MANAALDIQISEQGQVSDRSAWAKVQPFWGLLDPIFLRDPLEFTFPGGVSQAQVSGIWTWLHRDLAPDLFDSLDASGIVPETLDELFLALQARIKGALTTTDPKAIRRIQTQVGGEDAFNRLDLVMSALRFRALIAKAHGLGRAVNTITDEAAVQTALQSMPISDGVAGAILSQALVGQVAQPSRLIVAATKIAGSAVEPGLQRAGFGALVEAVLAHAQNQLPGLDQDGAFADIDLMCRALERYHRLMRGLIANVELTRGGRWATIVARLTKRVSERVEPKLRRVMQYLTQCLRPREGETQVDSDGVLAALNHLYLLATVRECRDSLALNATFERVWNQAGQALEYHLTRNLDLLRADPGNAVLASKVEAGIKMAELRFNSDYADVLRRARDLAMRRTAS
jgi:hypothetical protein